MAMIVTVQTILMLFRALVTVAGLLLLFLRNENVQNKIELFGQEFEISTPALAVFLSGCLIFVMPLLRPMEQLDRPAIVPGSSAAGQTGQIGSLSSSGGLQVAGEEKEPNGQITDANLMRFGTRARGALARQDDRDFFKFRTPERLPGQTRVIMRKMQAGGFWADLSVFDGSKNKVSSGDKTGDDPVSLSFEPSPNADYYVLVKKSNWYKDDRKNSPYEIEVRRE
jgi:hypothetical protein